MATNYLILWRIWCRHILVFFQAKDIVQIPSYFILQHWTRDATRSIKAIYIENKFDGQCNTSRILRKGTCTT